MPVVPSAPTRAGLALLLTLTLAAPRAHAAATMPGPPLAIQRAGAPIAVDGDLSDPGWQGITPITQWWETNVGDNATPQVGNTGWLAYDDRYLYAAFRFDDPHPELIRAPFADHDNLSGSTDYGGIIVDSGGSGQNGILFLANAHGLLYDGVSSDASGEDSSPDYYWEAAGRITATGWNLEMRIPFSSLRYARSEPQSWGIMLYRNYPRDRPYQFYSARQPKGANCFICNESPLSGLDGLPHGSHLVVAPYATAQREDAPRDGLGTPLLAGKVDDQYGVDVKWSPLASAAIDATVNPDFSQVEADAAQIGVNERFALFYPEKRSFFLEGIDLFSTPFQAVYTRSITAPRAGARVTGRLGGTAFTALATRDEGGGLVILPGAESSSAAPQDFESDVAIVRVRHDMGKSFLSVLATGRELRGGGHNAVAGPDFQWRPSAGDAITGQALWSDSRSPNRTDLDPAWDGRALSDAAWLLRWSHNSRSLDVFAQGQDLGPDFRADEGFMPQVGFREGYFETGYTIRPKDAFLSRVRMFTIEYYDEDHGGHPLVRRYSVGAGMDGRWNSFFRFELNHDDVKVGPNVFSRFQPYFTVQASPNRTFNNLSIAAHLNDEIDFDNARLGKGADLTGSGTMRVGNHLELRANASGRRLSVHDPVLGSGRLFAADIERLRATYTFNGRTFVRLIGQRVATTRTPTLYTFAVEPKSERFSLSALFAYKLNWQTVMFVGVGGDQAYEPVSAKLRPGARQAFAKLSYALQR